MIRVFVVAPTPMMIAGLHAMLTTTEIEVVGEAASLAEINIELPAIDVIVVDQLLLDEVARAIANDGRIALVVLTNNDERPLAILRNLSLRGWSLVPVGATSAELQASGGRGAGIRGATCSVHRAILRAAPGGRIAQSQFVRGGADESRA